MAIPSTTRRPRWHRQKSKGTFPEHKHLSLFVPTVRCDSAARQRAFQWTSGLTEITRCLDLMEDHRACIPRTSVCLERYKVRECGTGRLFSEFALVIHYFAENYSQLYSCSSRHGEPNPDFYHESFRKISTICLHLILKFHFRKRHRIRTRNLGDLT